MQAWLIKFLVVLKSLYAITFKTSPTNLFHFLMNCFDSLLDFHFQLVSPARCQPGNHVHIYSSSGAISCISNNHVWLILHWNSISCMTAWESSYMYVIYIYRLIMRPRKLNWNTCKLAQFYHMIHIIAVLSNK